MKTEMEVKGGAASVAATDLEASEEESLLMEGVAVLDFDMLCSTVAMQAYKGKWGKLNDGNEEENLVSDYQNGSCPCYRFGKNMKRAGFGSCFLQGSIHFILAVAALSNLLAFIFTRRRCFLYLAIVFTVSVGTYIGFYRTLIRKKFNIKGSDSSFDDCVYHLICPCCTLCQESRTLEMNNVEDGIWHGRGDTICIGTVSTTKSPECLGMQKDSNDS